MGIGGFFAKLIEQFPNLAKLLEGLRDGDKKINFYIDFNGIIHGSSAKIIAKHIDSSKYDKELIEQEICEQVKTDLLDVIGTIKPDFLLIAIDGVAPRAKMEQQRKRRYCSVKEKREQRQVFDSNSISPGTTFMTNLSAFMKTALEELKINFLFLDQTVEGEGEHKIFNYIKTMDIAERETIQHVVFGMDADLIMLSLATQLNNIFLLREKTIKQLKTETQKADASDFDRVYNFLSIEKIRTSYWEYINKDYKYSDHITMEQFFTDYVFIHFFIGNDFLPHLKVFNVYKDGIDVLIKLYLTMVEKTKSSIINEDLTINTKSLLIMFKDVYDNEEKYVVKNNKRTHDKVVGYGEPGWKNRYYDYYCNPNIDFLCGNYCHMLKWNLHYYFDTKCPNWSNYYQFNFAPQFGEIYEFIQNNDLNTFEIVEDKPYTMNQQLMCILPPQSSGLIPSAFRQLMFGKLKFFYPLRFKLDSVDKHMRYQWAPILPKLNDRMIKKFVQ